MMSHVRRAARSVLALLFVTLLIGSGSPAIAQTTSGTLYGTVYDSAGAPIVNARVTAVNETNGNARSTITGGDGSYRIPFLPPGRYTIRVSATDFQENSLTGFPIPLNSTTNLVPPITLSRPGGAQTAGGQQTTGQTATAQPAAGAAAEGESRASLVNLNDPARRGNFTERQVESLPLGGTTETRTFDELALLVPGVAPPPYTPGVRGPGVGFGIGTAGQFSVNGSRARSNNFTVDGSDNNDPDVGVRRQGFVSLVPQSPESVQEFQISTLLWDAELGRNSGAQVNAVSKSGGNEAHGQIYGFFTDSELNARNFFDYEGGASRGENPYTRAMAGLVLGGPIVRDRTQLFGSFEYQHISASTEQHFAVPTLADRRFLGLDAFGVLHQRSVRRFGIPNYITVSGTTPIGQTLLGFFPLPNNPGGPYGNSTYSEELPADGRGAIGSLKLTHQFTERHALNARYNITDDERTLPSVNRAIRSTIDADTRTQNLSLVLDSALSATLFNQARFSFGRTVLQFPEYPTSPFVFEREEPSTVLVIPDGDDPGGIRTFISRMMPVGSIVVEPFSPLGVDVNTFPQGRANNTFQYADTLSWTWRGHSFKTGADIRRVQLNSFQDRLYRPAVSFNNGAGLPLFERGDDLVAGQFFYLPGAALASLGLPSSTVQTLTRGTPNSNIGLRFTEYDFFFNDTWRVASNFAIDYGVRYEYNSVPTEVDRRIESALALENLPQPGSGEFENEFNVSFYTRAVEAYRSVLGGRSRIYDDDRNNFGPHIGFAWDPWGDTKTSIRAGYGIYYDTILGAVVSQSRSVFPSEIPINIDPSFVPFISFGLATPSILTIVGAGGRTIGRVVQPGTLNQFGVSDENFVAGLGILLGQDFGAGGLAFTLPEKNLRTPYTQQWHLTIERELFADYLVSAAYVGTKGTKLTRLTTPNMGSSITPIVPIILSRSPDVPPIVAFDQRFNDFGIRRPNPFLGAYQIFENSASSNYHAMQLEARKRYNHGYTFSAAYTWSHAIDDVSDVFPIAGAPVLPQDSRNLRLERGDASYDVRQRVSASFLWDLPFYRDETDGAAFWFGGWQLASVFQANTGQPFTLNVPFDANFDGNLTDRPFTTDGLVFLDEHGPRRVALAPGKDIVDFIDFRALGLVGRNTARGDALVNWDLALAKMFRFGETNALEVRGEVFNVLNRANFGLPIRLIGSPGFGSAVDTVTPARVVQFAMKYSF